MNSSKHFTDFRTAADEACAYINQQTGSRFCPARFSFALTDHDGVMVVNGFKVERRGGHFGSIVVTKQ